MLKIIIPAYQPDQRLLNLVKDIRTNSDFDIIIVNDGSDQKCVPIFEKAADGGCTVLTHKENQGKGAALKTAFSYLYENNSREGIICADCDGQHAWKDIQKLANVIPSHPTSIILGCRKFIGKVPFKSKFGNKITRAIFTAISGNKIRDTQTGLRGFQAAMLPWLTTIKGSRYEYEMNQLLGAKKAGFDFYSIPIETIYENNNEGSHFHPVIDSIRIYLPIVKFCLSSFTCALLDFILLLLFKYITDNLLYAVVAARIVSSICNYLLNRTIVFNVKSGKQLISLVQYYLLAVVILGGNYIILSLFNETIGIPLFVSKLLTEAILYPISYTVQNKLIFTNKSIKKSSIQEQDYKP